MVMKSIFLMLAVYTIQSQTIPIFLLFNHDIINIQKQPPEVFCKKRRSQKFCKIHRKTSVSESLLAQVFSCEFSEISKNTFLQYTYWRLLLNIVWYAYFIISSFRIKFRLFLEQLVMRFPEYHLLVVTILFIWVYKRLLHILLEI